MSPDPARPCAYARTHTCRDAAKGIAFRFVAITLTSPLIALAVRSALGSTSLRAIPGYCAPTHPHLARRTLVAENSSQGEDCSAPARCALTACRSGGAVNTTHRAPPPHHSCFLLGPPAPAKLLDMIPDSLFVPVASALVAGVAPIVLDLVEERSKKARPASPLLLRDGNLPEITCHAAQARPDRSERCLPISDTA